MFLNHINIVTKKYCRFLRAKVYTSAVARGVQVRAAPPLRVVKVLDRVAGLYCWNALAGFSAASPRLDFHDSSQKPLGVKDIMYINTCIYIYIYVDS